MYDMCIYIYIERDIIYIYIYIYIRKLPPSASEPPSRPGRASLPPLSSSWCMP